MFSSKLERIELIRSPTCFGHRLFEPRRNLLRPRDGPADDDGVRAEVHAAFCHLGRQDVAFGDDWFRDVVEHVFQELEVVVEEERAVRLGRIAVERRRDVVETESICFDTVLKRGTVGHQQLIRINRTDGVDEFLERHVAGTQALRRIEGDDVDTDFNQFFDFFHRRCDEYIAVRIVAFDNPDDRDVHLLFDFTDVFRRVGSDAFGAALNGCDGHPAHDVVAMERFIFECLAGDD